MCFLPLACDLVKFVHHDLSFVAAIRAEHFSSAAPGRYYANWNLTARPASAEAPGWVSIPERAASERNNNSR